MNNESTKEIKRVEWFINLSRSDWQLTAGIEKEEIQCSI